MVSETSMIGALLIWMTPTTRSKLLFKHILTCVGLATFVITNIINNVRLPSTLQKWLLPLQSTRATKRKNVDSCGLVNSKSQVHWRPFDEKEVSTTFHDFQDCFIRLTEENLRVKDTSMLMELDCAIDVNQTIVEWTIEQYRTIYFVGDSLMRHKYFSTICLIRSKTSRSQVIFGNQSNGFHTQFEYVSTDGARRTSIIYDRFGALFDREERSLYKNVFPRLIEHASSDDAIVLNAASHYVSQNAGKLQRALEFIAMKSLEAKASVFVIEPTTEEWPTSNGLYIGVCAFVCNCRAIDEVTMWGHGTFNDEAHMERFSNVIASMSSKENGIIGREAEDTFSMIYPSQWPLLKNTSIKKECGVNCGPNRWRIDLQRYIFAPETLGYSPSIVKLFNHTVQLVPIWWQLVSLGIPTTGRKGDCTHKNTYAMRIIAQQLIRTMLNDLQRKTIRVS